MALAKETRWKYEDASSRVDLPGRVEVLGAPVDPWTMEQTVEATDALIKEGRFAHLIGVNADKLLQMRDDPEMDACVRRCEIVNADGASMVMAAKKLGVDLPGRVAGIDLMWELCGLAGRKGRIRGRGRLVRRRLRQHPASPDVDAAREPGVALPHDAGAQAPGEALSSR